MCVQTGKKLKNKNRLFKRYVAGFGGVLII